MEEEGLVNTNNNLNSDKLSAAQLRKIKKPIIEKKRRSRINDSLSQLKTLILEALNKDESQYNKMEKADILELTVRHLKNMHNNLKTNQQHNQASSNCNITTSGFGCDTDILPISIDTGIEIPNDKIHIHSPTDEPIDNSKVRYREGFKACMGEVTSYLSSCDGLQPEAKTEIARHLSSRVTNQTNPALSPTQSNSIQANVFQNRYVQIAPNDYTAMPKPQIQQQNDIQQRSVIQSIPCVQPLQLLNGQTIFVATNTLPAMVQPQPFIQTQSGELCQVIEPTFVHSSDAHHLNAASQPPQNVAKPSAMLHAGQFSSPVQVLTYNVSPSASSVLSTNNGLLLSPGINTASVTDTPQSPVSPVLESMTPVENVKAINVEQPLSSIGQDTSGCVHSSKDTFTTQKPYEKRESISSSRIDKPHYDIHIDPRANISDQGGKFELKETSLHDQSDMTCDTVHNSPPRQQACPYTPKQTVQPPKDAPVNLESTPLNINSQKYNPIAHTSNRQPTHSTPKVLPKEHCQFRPINEPFFNVSNKEHLQALGYHQQIYNHSYGLHQVSPTSDKMWRPW